MKLNVAILSLLLTLGLALQTATAASPAIQQMAEVLLNMDNAASEAQREALKPIAEGRNVTANEQAMAKAILNINGKLAREDKQLVWGVLRDIGAFEAEKELAKILNGFKAPASPGLRKRLGKLAPPAPADTDTAVEQGARPDADEAA